MLTTSRGGRYYRVYSPAWSDPSDTTFSKAHGGGWNPPGEFGALYLNATLAVAAAQARHQHAGRAIKLFDLNPDQRPMLALFDISITEVLDAVSAEGVRALRFPVSFPFRIEWAPCQLAARRAYRARIAGVAARSNAEATEYRFVGEELAVFDSFHRPQMVGQGAAFANWYPDPIPE